jgi:hypothetical protein
LYHFSPICTARIFEPVELVKISVNGAQVCLMPIRYDERPEDRETEGSPDQAQSSGDPLQGLSLEQLLGHSGFRLCSSK